MRSLWVLCLLVLLCGFAAAQATVMGGTASNWAPPYGVYLAPYVPLVTTPSVTLSTVSPAAVGASNATQGLVAGATNATLSSEFVGEPSVGVYSQPVWYGSSAEPQYAGEPHHARMGERKERSFDFIASGTPGVAQSLPARGSIRKASKTYTNQDVDRVIQQTGTVKFGGKTEHL